jgi:hypothetical protein
MFCDPNRRDSVTGISFGALNRGAPMEGNGERLSRAGLTFDRETWQRAERRGERFFHGMVGAFADVQSLN